MRAMKQDNKVVTVESLKNAKPVSFCMEFLAFLIKKFEDTVSLEIILVEILFHLEPHNLAHIPQTSSWRLILANIKYLYEAYCKTATSRINCCGVWRPLVSK